MRRLSIIISLLLFLFVPKVAKADSLNEYELSIIEEAKKTYKVDGIEYQLDPIYLNALIDYLSAPDMDVTSEQKDKVFQKMYESIDQGIREGYLIPVKNSSEVEKEEVVTESGNSSDNSSDPEKSSDESSNVEEESPITEEGLIKDISNIVEEKNVQKTTTIDANTASVVVTDELEDPVLTLNTVIKNTGFSLNLTFIVVILVTMIMMIAVYVTYKFKLIAHSDE